MIRTFIAIDLDDKETKEKIISFSNRLITHQPRMKQVESKNLHMTVKFLGDIHESTAPKIYEILKEEINKELFKGKEFQFQLKGAGQFNRYSVIWIKLVGETEILQKAKDKVENLLYTKLKIAKDKRTKFKPHLTIGRLRFNKVDQSNFEKFKKVINDNKDFDFGVFNVSQIKLKKSVLTPKGPIYYNYKDDGEFES